MKNTEQFIKDAIAGGYAEYELQSYINAGYLGAEVAWAFLEPKVWQAVGETRGWFEEAGYSNWRTRTHRFIDHLADGLSIEDALGKL